MRYKLTAIILTAFLLFSTISVSAFTIPLKTRSSTGAAFTEVSTDNDVSSPNSLRLFASHITSFPPSNEARFRINLDSATLGDIMNMSFNHFVDHGYATHVDVILDLGGGITDALVFEYAKVDPSDCDDVADYPTGAINTFDDKGKIDEDTYAWLSSGPAGPCGDATFDSMHASLADWKTGIDSIDSTTPVLAIEIEIDGWIEESESFIDNIILNDILIENFDEETLVEVEIIELSLVSISPITIDFGSLSPGTSGNPALNGPVIIDPIGSNTDVHVEVTAVTGFPFETGLLLDGSDPTSLFWDFACVEVDSICTYTPASLDPTLDIPPGAVIGPKAGTISYLITGPTP